MDSIVFLYHQRLWTYGKILDKIVRQGGVKKVHKCRFSPLIFLPFLMIFQSIVYYTNQIRTKFDLPYSFTDKSNDDSKEDQIKDEKSEWLLNWLRISKNYFILTIIDLYTIKKIIKFFSWNCRSMRLQQFGIQRWRS